MQLLEQNLMNSTIFGVFIYQQKGKIVFANKRFANILGFEDPNEIIGKSILEFIPQEDREYISSLTERRSSGENFNLELQERYFVDKTDAPIPTSVFAYTIRYNNLPSGFVMVMDRMKEYSYKKLFFALSQINQLIVRADNENELLEKTISLLVEKAGYTASAIGYINNENLFIQLYTKAHTKEAETALKNVTIGADPYTAYGKGSVAKAFHTKQVSVVEDIDRLTIPREWDNFLKAFNIHSACSMPVLKNNRVAYIILIIDHMRSFDEDNLRLLEELQLDLSFALENIEKQKNMRLLTQSILNSHEWVVVADSKGTILDANSAVSKISGYDKDEIIGKTHSIFESGQNDNASYKKLWQTILSGKTHADRFVNKTKEGRSFYLDKIIMPIIQNNKIYRFVDLSRDVTDIVKKEEQIKLQSRLYNTLYGFTNLSMRTDNIEDFLKNLPELFVKYAGFDAAQIVESKDDESLSISYRFSKEDNYNRFLAFARSFLESLKESKTYSYPFQRTLKNGKIYIENNLNSKEVYKPFYLNAQKFNINLGSCCSLPIVFKDKIIGAVVLTSNKIDIFNKYIYDLLNTIVKQIEFIMNKLENDKFNRITLHALNNGFEFAVATNKDFRIIFANENALKISGYTQKELVGKHYSIFTSKRHTEDFIRSSYETLTSGQTYSEAMQYKMKDGSIKNFLVNIFPFIEQREITYYIAIGKEIQPQDEIANQLQNLMNYDSLTGLQNLYAFKQSIKQHIDRQIYEHFLSALLVIKPIDFKEINRAYGFDFGDKVLISIAQRLKNTLREYDVVAKLESDRFGVFLKDFKNEEDILVISQNILSTLKGHYIIGGKAVILYFNIGLIIITPQDGLTPEFLLNKANVALSDARRKGENTIGFFKEELRVKSQDRLNLIRNLNEAVTEKNLIAYYQPYVDKSGKIVGAEALMRWRWIKDGKVIPHLEFIDYLESSNLIIKAEELIFDQVIHKLKELSSLNIDISISINLSGKSLEQENIGDFILSSLNYYKIKHLNFRIEILERTLIENFDYINSLIELLKKHDIHFALDDFGTGYSSLSYLSKLSIKYLKIDISFVRAMLSDNKTKAIVESTIFLAKRLNIYTIAEGVETPEQFEALRTMGCDYFQGYLFYKPMPEDKFLEVVKENRANLT